MTDRPLEVALVTGMSGAGRSTAARALEDLGWFVMDNLPPSLLAQAIEIATTTNDLDRVAVVVDVRSGSMFKALAAALDDLESKKVLLRTLFLEASDESLVRRFESSRRPHPLQGESRIVDGLQAERILLGELRAEADVVVDTSHLNVHDLRRKVEAAFAPETPAELRATVLSFGFKYGIPVDADLVADMRFLDNPHWNPDLRALSGLDAAVADVVLENPAAQEFFRIYEELLNTMRPGYLSEGKRYVTIAIGCTGGKHRSVATAVEIARRLRATGIQTLVVHRDLGKE
ncbi:MAG: RNase adapter RapZ [Actinobacteria bacterium]|uniref:Unannotated protein n=1 Tax=freshwater metagenome TaxID=449393 RepID=A0A6J7FLW6_9ZZZZ|nr:RNase adapter RapZ [Actinomycetota bacterium]MTB28271.1 RNase adapter RapZ [Actinomycetota bacterium]